MNFQALLMQRRAGRRSLVSNESSKETSMKAIQPAKALLIAAVIGLGLSGGFAAAAFLPGGSAPAAVAQLWDNAVGRSLENGPGDKGSVFTAAATYIGITEAQLRTELGTDKSLADVAVAHGKTRDGLVQALVTASQTSITTLVDQKGIGAQRGPGGGGRGIIGDQLSVAATYLGTTTADLQTKMQAGQTLAQIAAATSGKSRDGLVAALTTDAKAKIAAAQTAGAITADKATEETNELATEIANFVDSTRPQGPAHR